MNRIFGIIGVIFLAISSHAQILAIDFGTEFIKAAVVNKGSGKAFSIVETSKSERKFLNSIGFYSEERFYESESIPKRTKYPENCFIFSKLLIDSVLNPELRSTVKRDLLLEYIEEGLSDPLLANFTLKHFPEESSKVTLIEVVAMIIKYARANAEKQIKEQIKDVVLTIPSYWNLRMRAFIVEAAQIADLHVLSVISENSAAAINYALNQRTKNTTETILLYNLGSNSLEMTLAEFRQVPEEKSPKPVESVFILGDYSKTYVGGLKFDSLLHSFFKASFEKKHKKPLNFRGQMKLWGEVSEVKEVLSSNKEAQIYVEGIMDGIDYNDKVTRVQFEEMIDSYLTEVTSPIKRFLFDHNLRPDDLDSVELIGGSSRIPKLQTMISEIIGNQSKVGTHINADEAMVLGAAFYGANSSKKFKVKGVNFYDGFNFEIRAVLRNLEENIDEDDPKYFYKNVTVFTKKSRFGLTKELNFKCTENIIIELYKDDETGLELLRSDKIDNIANVNESEFKVSITLAIDPLEVVSLKKAEIKYKRDEIVSYVEKVKKTKSTSSEKEDKKEKDEVIEEDQEVKEDDEKEKDSEGEQDESEKEEEKEEEKSEEKSEEKEEEKEEEEENAENEENVRESEEEEEEEKEEIEPEQKSKSTKSKDKKKKRKESKDEYETVQRNKTVTKKYERDLHSVSIFSREKADHETLEKSRTMLKEYERAEQERKNLAESKNKLEGLIYEIKEKMDNEDFLEYVKKEEKEKLLSIVSENEEWYDETNSRNKLDYDEHSKLLARPLDKIKKRIHEEHHRESHLKKAKATLKEYRELSQNITKKKEWITHEEIDTLISKIDEYSHEIKEMYEKMVATPKNENSVFQIKDLDKTVDKAKDEYFKVMSIQKPKKEKKEEKKKEEEEEESEEL